MPPALAHPALAGLLQRLPTRVQVVHADDVADAIRKALRSDARGAFKLAAGPVLGSVNRLSRPTGALLRTSTALAWHARPVAAAPGCVELLFRVPVRDVLTGIHEGVVDPRTPALERPGQQR